MNKASVQIIRLSDRVAVPSYAKPGDAGFDLQSNEPYTIHIDAGASYPIRTGIKLWIRDMSLVGLIVPKSGKGTQGYGIKNFTGVIDSQYQGEIIVHIWNTNILGECIVIPTGMKIAQMIIVPFMTANFQEVTEFTETTARGENGFGHSDSLDDLHRSLC